MSNLPTDLDLVAYLRDVARGAFHYSESLQKRSAYWLAADEIERLRGLLQALCDEQNGPPLEGRREQWRRAFDQARAVLRTQQRERLRDAAADLGVLPTESSDDVSEKPCTCHPDDNPPRPCPRKYALSECRRAADTRG